MVMGGTLTVIGLGELSHLDPAGPFIAGGGGVMFALGLELTYRSLGDIRPESWPRYLLIERFELP